MNNKTLNAKAYKAHVEGYPIKEWPSVFMQESELTTQSLKNEQQRLNRRYQNYCMLLENLDTLCQFDRRFMGEGLAIGVDEAGRGPLAGPVVAAACVIRPSEQLLGLNDSKKLSEPQREALFQAITSQAIAFGIGEVSHQRIDEINILNATKEAMAIAIHQVLKQLSESETPIEGPVGIITDHVKLTGFDLPMLAEVKGDQKSLSVAAASILAKVTRDRIMKENAFQYPGYGFEIHKGYGTPMHYDAIKMLGISQIHRLTFLKNLDRP